MILNVNASYPSTHAYVVKLHRDCGPDAGHLAGRLEHVSSGRTLPFHSADELIACLLSDMTVVATEERRS